MGLHLIILCGCFHQCNKVNWVNLKWKDNCQKPQEGIKVKDWEEELETQVSLAERKKKTITQNFGPSFTLSTTVQESRISQELSFSVHVITR